MLKMGDNPSLLVFFGFVLWSGMVETDSHVVREKKKPQRSKEKGSGYCL